MKTRKSLLSCNCCGLVVGLLIAGSLYLGAQTIWNGPTTNFFHPYLGVGDSLTPGVTITRGSMDGLYNSVTETEAVVGVSPKDTEWALGALSNYNKLTYSACPLESGERPPEDLNKTFVVHLVNENIYFSLKLTNWGGAGGAPDEQTFGYIRSTPSPAPPTPSVSITSPTNGASFTAPANVPIKASASVGSGTVTNVAFFAGTTLLGSVQTSPFNFTAEALAAGSYSLTAVATAAGVSATSTVVQITVEPPAPSVSITNPVGGSVFAAPANVTIAASASVSEGTVTNVTFYSGATPLGSATSAPFAITINNLAANNYAFTAVATAAGISATSAVVSISVVTPVPITNSAPFISGGVFSFSYAATPGLSYVIESSPDLINWMPIATNDAESSSEVFSDSISLTGENYYRVGLLPNP